MSKKPFDKDRYIYLYHRVNELMKRLKLDFGPERETTMKLLKILDKKLCDFLNECNIPKRYYKQLNELKDFSKEVVSTSSFSFWEALKEGNVSQHDYCDDDGRSEESMINDLGVIYAIFGSTYETYINYHVYVVRFKRQTDKEQAFFRVYVDIYEDGTLICDDVIIGFWPYHQGDSFCGDMQFSSMDAESIKKYDNGCTHIYKKITWELKNLWNSYFEEPLLMIPEMSGRFFEESNEIKMALSQEERDRIVEYTHRFVWNSEVAIRDEFVHKSLVQAYKPFRNLNDFLKNSGVVYKVEEGDVLIWNIFNEKKEEYCKLLSIKYDSSICQYVLRTERKIVWW